LNKRVVITGLGTISALGHTTGQFWDALKHGRTGIQTLFCLLSSVFASNSKHRALVTPAKRGKSSKSRLAEGRDEKTPVQRYVAMTWAQRLKRVFTNGRRFRRY